MTHPTRYLSVKEVAALVGTSTYHVYEALRRRELKSGRTSKGKNARYKIRPEDVDAWLEGNAA